jgi:Protein of unknown function (DUF1583)
MSCCTMAVLLWASLGPTSPEARIDFRGKPLNHPLFRPSKPEQARYLVSEPAGLRINVPPGETTEPVGVTFFQQLLGDFDITVQYELLQARGRPGDWGSGIQLLLPIDNEKEDRLIIARYEHGAWGQTYQYFLMTNAPDGSRQAAQTRTAPANPSQPTGRFHVVRQGDNISVFIAEGAGSEAYRKLGTFAVGNQPVRLLRVAANPERDMLPVDIRIGEIAVKAEQFAEPVDGDGTSLFRRKSFWLLAVIVILALAVAGSWLWTRRRNASRLGTVPASGLPNAPSEAAT